MWEKKVVVPLDRFVASTKTKKRENKAKKSCGYRRSRSCVGLTGASGKKTQKGKKGGGSAFRDKNSERAFVVMVVYLNSRKLSERQLRPEDKNKHNNNKTKRCSFVSQKKARSSEGKRGGAMKRGRLLRVFSDAFFGSEKNVGRASL